MSLIVAAQGAPLIITTASLNSGQVGTAYGTSLAAAGGTTPYTWTLTSGSLPAGLNLGATGQITGTPTQSGTSTFSVQLADSSSPSQTAAKSLNITIAAAVAPPQITNSSVPDAQAGAAYSATLVATGGTTPYSWSIASGALPAGVTLSGTGTISGTPIAAGTFSFTAKVTDSTTPTAQTTTKTFTLTVSATAIPVQITTSALPAGQAGTVYSATLTASGGTTPYNWSIASGALPAGVTLSGTGTISGTPTAAGTFTIMVKVTDSRSPASTATASFSFTLSSFSAVLNWQPSPSSDVAGYDVYRSTASGSGYVKINSSLVGGLTFTDDTLAGGQTYYYVTTSVDSDGVESTYSGAVQAVSP